MLIYQRVSIVISTINHRFQPLFWQRRFVSRELDTLGPILYQIAIMGHGFNSELLVITRG